MVGEKFEDQYPGFGKMGTTKTRLAYIELRRAQQVEWESVRQI